mmetsp:Transcript_1119/g.2385  ORF Transcript_1119/g.2385 Transcript_1119/m.2385 type:complete len:354 (-) Transcript_1119:1964-3025(-)
MQGSSSSRMATSTTTLSTTQHGNQTHGPLTQQQRTGRKCTRGSGRVLLAPATRRRASSGTMLSGCTVATMVVTSALCSTTCLERTFPRCGGWTFAPSSGGRSIMPPVRCPPSAHCTRPASSAAPCTCMVGWSSPTRGASTSPLGNGSCSQHRWTQRIPTIRTRSSTLPTQADGTPSRPSRATIVSTFSAGGGTARATSRGLSMTSIASRSIPTHGAGSSPSTTPYPPRGRTIRSSPSRRARSCYTAARVARPVARAMATSGSLTWAAPSGVSSTRPAHPSTATGRTSCITSKTARSTSSAESRTSPTCTTTRSTSSHSPAISCCRCWTRPSLPRRRGRSAGGCLGIDVYAAVH